MLGYFDPPFPGELLHSAIARTARLHGLKSEFDIGIVILGKRTRPAYGIQFPRFGSVLIKNTPEALCLDAATLLSHSLYPAYAPFLDEAERLKLRTSILDGVNRGKLCRESQRPLRFCPQCAADDFERHRTVFWYAAHQHSGITACAKCGSRLVETKATLGVARSLLFAPDWIDLKQSSISATEPEIALARDLEWLLARNTEHPGGARLSTALKGILGSNERYRRGSKTIRFPRVIADVRAHFGPLLSQIDLTQDWHLRHAISPNNPSLNFQAYSTIGQLVGVSLSEIFSLAMRADQPVCLSGRGEAAVDEGRILRAKENIQRFLRDNPGAGLKLLHQLRPRHLNLLLEHAPDWCASNLPARKSKGGDYHSPRTVDWEERDKQLAAAFTAARTRLLDREKDGPPMRINNLALLNEIGSHKRLTKRELDRLPLAKAALEAALDTPVSYVGRRALWMEQHCAASGRRFSFLRFIDLGNMRYDCEDCPNARALAHAAWQRFRQKTEVNNVIACECPPSAT